MTPTAPGPLPVRLLLTGPPGCGKTTVVCRVLEELAGWRIAGFYTQELRERGQRVGFEAVTADGQHALLARRDSRSPHRVGRYGVELEQFELLVADQLLRPADAVDLFVIDEIGKMECLSERFVAAVRRVLASPVPLLATVAQKGRGLIAEVKQTDGGRLLVVTRTNRDALPGQVVQMLQNRG